MYNEIPWPDVRAAINAEDSYSAGQLVSWLRRTYSTHQFENLSL
jgi:hypothetical protein